MATDSYGQDERLDSGACGYHYSGFRQGIFGKVPHRRLALVSHGISGKLLAYNGLLSGCLKENRGCALMVRNLSACGNELYNVPQGSVHGLLSGIIYSSTGDIYVL